MAIFSGLVQLPIQRLKRTWKTLNFTYAKKWKGLQELMIPFGNFKNLKLLEMKVSPPKIPCLSMVIHDLELTEEGNENFCDEEKKIFESPQNIGSWKIIHLYFRSERRTLPA